MAVKDQKITDDYGLYLGDCVSVMPSFPDESMHLSIYSPPFGGVYNYSSSERDLSNCKDYDQFFQHYEFVVKEIFRLTMTGRCSAVHCADVARGGARLGEGLIDFSGDIIRLHERIGFQYSARYHVWKEPLGVRNRTMAKGLAHRQVVEDSTLCDVASADYLLLFRKPGENKIPVEHLQGLINYAGSREVPEELHHYRGYKGNQIENRYSHWIWRQYASAFWDDVRLERTLPYKESKDPDDEKHVHPLQLDVIERTVILRSNPGENVLSPFAGVGSEPYGAVINDRKGIGIELKPSYFKQAVRNLESIKRDDNRQMELF